MFARAKLVPRRVRTEARFRAADPWNGDAPAELSIEAYYYVPEHVREADAPWRWCDTPLYALRSETGGAERFLPDALGRLWREGRIPAEALPRLLREMEPELEEEDFQPLLEVRTERWLTALSMVVVLGIAGLLVAWPAGGQPGLSLTALVCGGMVAGGGVLGAVLLLLSYFARRRRRRWLMGWALARRASAQPDGWRAA
jgi:hypothetical protein